MTPTHDCRTTTITNGHHNPQPSLTTHNRPSMPQHHKNNTAMPHHQLWQENEHLQHRRDNEDSDNVVCQPRCHVTRRCGNQTVNDNQFTDSDDSTTIRNYHVTTTRDKDVPRHPRWRQHMPSSLSTVDSHNPPSGQHNHRHVTTSPSATLSNVTRRR
ncbi:uncharacterized protein LACBIDRAFT_335784 [Laccaria bicolor S238N-H82]|uniref:Predicted protein n=1 Tax=Laccaria bicolor (strain S238N-H82 / ATCC MYA-4686) TaxID=486041 RepID=B0E3E5_LACBS|nr:uncharacterized protein LACBIDRAFT_335784 [Laccaria bicolor S238N-H82]EDQ98643.1 predicted protein [Laccaria bicolor S238N-H82]|eukprot:XP_001890709.1 predicted protein [Laccaria bicolor S238N-H82]